MSEIRDLSGKLRAVPKKLTWELADKALPVVVDALKADYPAEHSRTGKARQAIGGKAYGPNIRLKSGVRKKKSFSGKRRKSRTGKINYCQFLPWMLAVDDVIEAAIDSVMKDLDAL